MKTVQIQYFALLREQRGRSEETVTTRCATPAELYQELRRTHPFTLEPERLRVAQNGEFVAWDAPLLDQGRIVFLPPVAGG